ncbi:putative Gramicidin S biosynthesis protein GrsT [Blattamonas nauphoetae]|uniref:Gramicidin S biosynthesis protein GrsT n=1 Tax=Blattamonas nauphoetae TaxID=2049346 RepID=A0ABQ9YFM5_9EUKA|nr:putative Gramicidin S biosynthesis protein GrsT [Blattamonas nauphoetae]
MNWLLKNHSEPERIHQKAIHLENYGKYLVTPEKKQQPVIRLYCFPFAGGTASVFTHGWSEPLPQQIEYIAIQLPGRQSRIDELCVTDIRKLTRQIVDEMEPLIKDKAVPYAFLGHSLGTLIAWECAHEIRRRKLVLPLHFLFSGRGAPGASDSYQTPVDIKSSDKEFADICVSRFGPSQALLDKQLWPLSLPPLRGDLELYYRTDKWHMRALPVPLTVWGAHGDPISQESLVETWETFTPSTHTIPANSRVVITGGSSGIGEELAKRFAKRGANLLLLARRKEELERVAEECRKLIEQSPSPTSTCTIVVTDVTKKESVIQAAAVAENTLHSVDYLFLNAGVSMDLTFDDLATLDELDAVFRPMIDVNYFGCLYVTKAFAPLLKKNKGQLILISTGSGVLGLPRRSGYVASKHAVQGFMNSLRNEWKEQGITITTVCPGFVETGIRTASVNGGRAKEAMDPERNLMSVQDCVTHIVKATEQRRKTYHIPFSGQIGAYVYQIPILGDIVDSVLRGKMNREKAIPITEKKDL